MNPIFPNNLTLQQVHNNCIDLKHTLESLDDKFGDIGLKQTVIDNNKAIQDIYKAIQDINNQILKFNTTVEKMQLYSIIILTATASSVMAIFFTYFLINK